MQIQTAAGPHYPIISDSGKEGVRMIGHRSGRDLGGADFF